MGKCQCSMSISVLGDGCRYCQPQEHIDRLLEQMKEDRIEAEAVQWQPIETAPKDGTIIQGRPVDEQPYRWKKYSPQAAKQMKREGRWQSMGSHGGWDNSLPPAVWMPLPQPPKEGE